VEDDTEWGMNVVRSEIRTVRAKKHQTPTLCVVLCFVNHTYNRPDLSFIRLRFTFKVNALSLVNRHCHHTIQIKQNLHVL